MDKSNGDGVETENSFTLGVIGVAASGPEEATFGLTKLLPVDRQPLPVLWKSQMLPSELSGQQSECLSTARKVLPVTCDVEYSLPVEPEVVFRSSADVP